MINLDPYIAPDDVLALGMGLALLVAAVVALISHHREVARREPASPSPEVDDAQRRVPQAVGSAAALPLRPMPEAGTPRAQVARRPHHRSRGRWASGLDQHPTRAREVQHDRRRATGCSRDKPSAKPGQIDGSTTVRDAVVTPPRIVE